MAVRDKGIFIPNNTYFITFTILDWKHIFTQDKYCQLVFKWFDYMRKKYDNKIYGYVIMPNHIHALIYLTDKSSHISKLIQNGATVYTHVMSKCDDQFEVKDKGKLVSEYEKAMSTLGVTDKNLYDFPNKELPKYQNEMMDIFNKLQIELKPDLVLIPYLKDPHQDHNAVAHTAIRAFRGLEAILQYEILRHSSYTFTSTLFVDISNYLEIKIKALTCYKSQIERRAYFDEESFRALARTRGAQSGFNYAEGFVVYKMFW